MSQSRRAREALYEVTMGFQGSERAEGMPTLIHAFAANRLEAIGLAYRTLRSAHVSRPYLISAERCAHPAGYRAAVEPDCEPWPQCQSFRARMRCNAIVPEHVRAAVREGERIEVRLPGRAWRLVAALNGDGTVATIPCEAHCKDGVLVIDLALIDDWREATS